MKNLSSTLRIVAAIAVVSAITRQADAATTFQWNVPSGASGPWNVNADWLPNTGNPGSADTALFGVTGTNAGPSAGPNSIVSVSTAITSLQYTNNLAISWHVTQIPGGVTLTTSG